MTKLSLLRTSARGSEEAVIRVMRTRGVYPWRHAKHILSQPKRFDLVPECLSQHHGAQNAPIEFCNIRWVCIYCVALQELIPES